MRHKLLRTTMLGTTVLASSLAIAQTADEPAGQGLAMEEIIVTAQKREQSLQDVPVSLRAVSGEELAERNINELTQLTLAAPTLQVGQDNTFSIRGIGTQVSVETIDQSVGLSIDGVSLGRNALAGQPFNDIAAVEVLNGPQGLLFGKNAAAGLINITTQMPVVGEFEGSVSLEHLLRDSTPDDSNGTVFKGTLNIPVSDKSALRINALYSDQDSIIENIFPNTGVRTDLDQERWGIKAKYLYEDGPLSVYVIADFNENNGAGGRFSRTFRELGAGSELIPALAADNIVPGKNNLTNNSDGAHFSDLENGGAQATVSYEFGNGMEIINIAAWRYYKRDQNIHSDFSSVVDIDENINQSDYDQFSNEVRLVWPQNDSFSGQLGLFYFKSESTEFAALEVIGPPPFVAVGFPFCVGAEAVPGPPPNCPVSNDVFLGSDAITDLDAESYAAFGQFDFYLTEQLTVTAGGRITRDEVSSDVVQSQLNYFVPIGGPRGVFSENVDNTNFSWKLGAQYHVSDSLMVYGSVGQGYKAPGFNTDNLDIPEVPFAVEEEVSTTVEIGLKSQFWDDRAIFNLSVFNTEFKDYQNQSFNLIARGFILQNASSVTSRGAEMSLSALLSENFTVNWNVALLDAEFDDFDGASCSPDIVACAGGLEFFDASGFATPLSADVTSNLQVKYEQDLGDTMDLFVEANMYYRSDVNYGIGSPARELGSVSLFNFSTGITTDNGWRVSLFCKNCTDKKVPTSLAFDPGENNRGFATVNQSWGLDSVRAIGLTAAKAF